MPEICEVALTAQYLLSKLKSRYLTGMEIVGGKYLRQNIPGKNLIKKNIPLKILNIDSKGKLMWFELQDPDGNYIFIINNFGMTGHWSFKEDKNDRVIFDIETNPNSDNKYKLHYSDPRNFGLLEISNNPDVLQSKLDNLAPDLLKTDFTVEDFAKWVDNYISKSPKRKNNPIIRVLLEQTVKDGIGSGIGNYLSSEILYRAKISPLKLIGNLSFAEIKKLAQTIKYVLKLCYISNYTGYMTKLKDFVDVHSQKVKEGEFPNYHPGVDLDDDDTFEFLVYGKKEDDLGNNVQTDVITKNRTTYWVPSVQK